MKGRRTNWARLAFLHLVARPLAAFFTGADVVGREHLPTAGPAIIAANHNSHVDTLLLLSIFPARLVGRLRPMAAADYFLRGPLIGWFSRTLIGIVPIVRTAGGREDVLAPAREALAAGDIVIVFPEGTRGDGDDEMGPLKSGVARLAAAFPEAPVIPIWIEGAGRVLPKGALLPAPMNCTVLAGEPVGWCGERTRFLETLRERLEALRKTAPPQRWLEDPPSPPRPRDGAAAASAPPPPPSARS
ncbi:MAG TPA: lysophospholipid acyltransferase family protein [Caulobacteraceae bacterium]|nr:lysophospholipid acyltransferase family protein [Caulobacteraceae bacterium]